MKALIQNTSKTKDKNDKIDNSPSKGTIKFIRSTPKNNGIKFPIILRT